MVRSRPLSVLRTRMTERLALVLATKPTVFVCNLVQYTYYIAHVVSKQSFVARCCCCCWGRQSYANHQHHKLLTTRLPVSILLCSANARACAQRNYNRELWPANIICIRLWSGSLPNFAAGCDMVKSPCKLLVCMIRCSTSYTNITKPLARSAYVVNQGVVLTAAQVIDSIVQIK